MKQVIIPGSPGYTVWIGGGLLDEAGGRIAAACGGKAAMLVADDDVCALYGDAVEGSLKAAGYRTARFIFPHGEKSKTLDTYSALIAALAGARITRTDVVVALGGGVSCDLAGFAAATYLRGIPYVQLPTSLLAMVDCAVGGKTAVNLPAGKNLAGAFWHPRLILCDLAALRTLPPAHFRDGCAEMIKHGVIASAGLFAMMKEPLTQDSQLEDLIELNVAIKRDVAARDEGDAGSRQLLDFGHTVAHAIETLSGYKVTHGGAVAAGMAIMSRGAYQIGLAEERCPREIERILDLYGFRTGLPFDAGKLAEAAVLDKKQAGGKITLVLPEKIGKCAGHNFKTEELAGFLKLALRNCPYTA